MTLRSRCSLDRIRNRLVLLLAALVLASWVAAVAAPEAGAYRRWCRTDPVVSIDGVIVDVFVAGPLEAPILVTGPTQVVVTVPRGVDAWLVASDLGFGKGVEVSFAESPSLRATAQGIEVRVDVYVPSRDDAMPVLVEFAARLVGLLAPTSVEGTANRWVDLRAWA